MLKAAGLQALLGALRPVLPRRWHLPTAFDPAGYLAQNPDIAAQGGSPALHFLRHGRIEGRLPAPLRAARLEAALWTGEAAARAELERLHSGQGPEALWAGLALARGAAMSGNWGRAAAALGLPDAFLDGIGLPDALCLRAEMALRMKDRAGAADYLRLLRARFGPLPEWHLLCAAAAFAQGDHAGWTAALAPLYAPHRLVVPELAGAGFDAVTGVAPPLPLPPDAPLVSVVMPARNAAATIGTAISGILAQSWTRLELLVVENGSEDDTAARVAARAAQDPRLRLIRGAAEAGAYGARNLGAAEARGAFIALQDADDWSHPDRLARQMQALAANPDMAACLSHWVRMTPDLCPAFWRPDVRGVHPNLSSILLRRAVLDRIGPWDRVRAGADTEFAARLRHVFGPGAVAMVLPGVPLAFGRVVPGSLTQGAETGLAGPGAAARAAYLAAAADWHRSTPLPRMPDAQAPRPFPVPAALRLAPEDATERAGE
jgi:hypothetical protein